jgi:hypothetical protein
MCVETALVLGYLVLSNSCCLKCSGFSEPFILVQISFALRHRSEWVRTIVGVSEYASSTMACHWIFSSVVGQSIGQAGVYGLFYSLPIVQSWHELFTNALIMYSAWVRNFENRSDKFLQDGVHTWNHLEFCNQEQMFEVGMDNSPSSHHSPTSYCWFRDEYHWVIRAMHINPQSNIHRINVPRDLQKGPPK